MKSGGGGKWEEAAAAGLSLMEAQYQKTLELADDIKSFVGKAGSGKAVKVRQHKCSHEWCSRAATRPQPVAASHTEFGGRAPPPPKRKSGGPAPPPQIEGQGPVVKGRSGQESGERG